MLIYIVLLSHNRLLGDLHLLSFAFFLSYGPASASRLFPIQHVFFSPMDCDYQVVSFDGEHSHSADGFPHFFLAVFVRLKCGVVSICFQGIECQGLNWITIKYGRTDRRRKKSQDHVFRRGLVALISLKYCKTKKGKKWSCFE